MGPTHFVFFLFLLGAKRVANLRRLIQHAPLLSGLRPEYPTAVTSIQTEQPLEGCNIRTGTSNSRYIPPAEHPTAFTSIPTRHPTAVIHAFKRDIQQASHPSKRDNRWKDVTSEREHPKHPLHPSKRNVQQPLHGSEHAI